MAEIPQAIRSLREVRKLLAAALVLAALCFGGGLLAGRPRTEAAPALSSVVVQNQLRQVSQLATARYGYTNMGQFEQSSDFYGVTLPFTTKRFIVSYQGAILAGVDLESAQVELTDTRLTVILPAAQILSHEIDPDSLEVFDETRNIFNPITIEDYNGFQADQREKMEQNAVESGLLTQAEEQAKLVAEQILGPVAEQSGLELVVKASKTS